MWYYDYCCFINGDFMKRFFVILCTLFCSVNLFADGGTVVYRTLLSKDINKLEIVRHPAPADFKCKLSTLPKHNPNNKKDTSDVDIRSCDFSGQDFSGRFSDLIMADFDSKTIWPERLPLKFDPTKVMALGKIPGLSIRKLHKNGITGKGVGIAIIDQALLVDHWEYKDRLKMYEEIHWADNEARMHGPAVASIAVGKTVGVAPEANLYYIAEENFDHNDAKGIFEWDIAWIAKAIDRIIEVNKTLPIANKIRVISISLGIGKWFNGYEKALDAIERAKKENIYVIHTEEGFLGGLGRDPLKNPDKATSYEKGLFWQDYNNYQNNALLVPMDSRGVASNKGNNDYVFYRKCGLSWAVPYLAGLYALACQVKPDITPELFKEKAFATGDTITIDVNGKKQPLGKIVNPIKLIDSLKSNAVSVYK
jgi:hypothetical protein